MFFGPDLSLVWSWCFESVTFTCNTNFFAVKRENKNLASHPAVKNAIVLTNEKCSRLHQQRQGAISVCSHHCSALIAILCLKETLQASRKRPGTLLAQCVASLPRFLASLLFANKFSTDPLRFKKTNLVPFIHEWNQGRNDKCHRLCTR